jgi:hypothetical protein
VRVELIVSGRARCCCSGTVGSSVCTLYCDRLRRVEVGFECVDRTGGTVALHGQLTPVGIPARSRDVIIPTAHKLSLHWQRGFPRPALSRHSYAFLEAERHHWTDFSLIINHELRSLITFVAYCRNILTCPHSILRIPAITASAIFIYIVYTKRCQ